VPRRGRFGLYHFAILLPDRAALGRFAAHALGLRLRPGMADHAVSEALYLSDPDGLGIEVYADRPSASWTYRGDELVMTTEPLDLDDLLTAGEGEVWSIAPEGTTMGHVHLHVGDLARADAFYHRALGFDKTVWSYPGALFFSAGGYHHHLGTNIWSPGPSARADEAKLLEWELVVPARKQTHDVAQRLRASGYPVDDAPDGVRAADPWGTHVYVRSEESR
jgi:catechol 2,3-dioxygenase